MESSFQSSLVYLSASTNRFSSAADIWDSCVIYGSSCLVIVYDLETECALESLVGHEGLVTTLHFISQHAFLSGDDRGMLRCWHRAESRWSSTEFQAHEGAISSICVFGNCVATGASDSTVKIWTLGETDLSLNHVQDLSLGGKYPLSIAMASLPNTQATILAIAGTERKINIWTRSDETFVPSATLGGHDDWVKSLDFLSSSVEGDPLILASGSQDASIRLWNIEVYVNKLSETTKDALSDDLLDAFEASLAEIGEDQEGGRQISLKKHIITSKLPSGTQQFSITFDALLIGHEAGVTSVKWRPRSSLFKTPTLLSTSTDSSLILWSPSSIGSTQNGASSLWINQHRFGDVGGQRLGGFVGGAWNGPGIQVMAWGWAGGWRRWACQLTDELDVYTEIGGFGGHKGPIKDIAWSPNGDYILSAGSDQTTRIHGLVLGASTWHELARPQVHGYDMQAVAFLDNLKFASVADEKVARVFEAPTTFLELLTNLGTSTFDGRAVNRPSGAVVPPLGLSNKASNELAELDINTQRRPFQGELGYLTLWPETEKIFGHGYELISIAASHSRKLVATACRASSPEHAMVRLYDTTSWKLVGEPISGHTLTITRIAFSPDDRMILSVSRDRSWVLSEVQAGGVYVHVASNKTHGRIIWDCAWSKEGDLFATAARDKTVRIWSNRSGFTWAENTVLKTPAAATAVDVSTTTEHGRRLIAIGLETGVILIYSNKSTHSEWTLVLTLDSREAHAGHVTRVAWRPGNHYFHLASCGEDGTMRLTVLRMTADANSSPIVSVQVERESG